MKSCLCIVDRTVDPDLFVQLRREADSQLLPCGTCGEQQPHTVIVQAGRWSLVCWGCGFTSTRVTH